MEKKYTLLIKSGNRKEGCVDILFIRLICQQGTLPEI